MVYSVSSLVLSLQCGCCVASRSDEELCDVTISILSAGMILEWIKGLLKCDWYIVNLVISVISQQRAAK